MILDAKDCDRWLGKDRAAPQPPTDLLRPYPAERMRSWKVSDWVGNVRNNDPELLAPLEEQLTAGQPSLFG